MRVGWTTVPTSKNLRTKLRVKGAQNLPQLQQVSKLSVAEPPIGFQNGNSPSHMFKNFKKHGWLNLFVWNPASYCEKQKMLIKKGWWWVITKKILQQWVGYRSNSKQMAPNQLWELLTRLAPATGVCKATEKEMSWNLPDVRVATGGCWRFPWEKIHMFPVVFQDPCWLPGITQRPLPPR